ncbi:MAG: hypothetical protein FJX74_08185 [Armatimonadetes bacterium]|nr:hypothetical protein [Armatimonadota bacterium]
MSAPQGPSGAPATDVLDAATRDPNPEVRLEALRLLGRTTGPEFEEALGAAAEAGSMEAKARAAELYLDLGDRQWKAAQDAPLEAYAQALDLATTDEVHSRALRALAALATARPPAKESFVHNDALVQAAQAARADAARRRDERAQAAEALEAAGKDSDPRVRWEALRRLGRVNGPEAEETLRALGATGTVPELASVAEVYLELGNERWRAARDVPLDAYARALDLAAADHMRHQALNALAVLGRATPPTDGRAGPIRSVREAALAAYVTAAGRIADQGQAERAVGMLRKVLDLDATRQTRAAATAKLRELGVDIDPAALVGFVTHWWVIGPFPGHDIAREYPPERGVDLAAEINGLKWVKHHTPDVSGLVDLNSFVQPDRDVTAYLYAEVTVDRDHAVLLKTGSDDNEKIWLNGQVIYTYPDNRSITIDDNTVNAQLVAGRNGILVKVGNDGLGWLVCLRITDPDGRPLDFIQRTD